MGFGVVLRVRGNYACFTRPEMKAERVSYDVITPSAARGILEAIFWKPAIAWRIDRLHVLNPIRFDSVRRNEVSNKVSTRNVLQAMSGKKVALGIDASDTKERVQRASYLLREVDYVIEAHFDLTDRAGPGTRRRSITIWPFAVSARASGITSRISAAESSRSGSAG